MRRSRPVKGRILKVKPGYNPNSSSIGTHITVFLSSSAVFAMALNTLLAFMYWKKVKKTKTETPEITEGPPAGKT